MNEGADCQMDCAAEKSVENALSRALVEGNLLRNRRDILLSNIQWEQKMRTCHGAHRSPIATLTVHTVFAILPRLLLNHHTSCWWWGDVPLSPSQSALALVLALSHVTASRFGRHMLKFRRAGCLFTSIQSLFWVLTGHNSGYDRSSHDRF